MKRRRLTPLEALRSKAWMTNREARCALKAVADATGITMEDLRNTFDVLDDSDAPDHKRTSLVGVVYAFASLLEPVS